MSMTITFYNQSSPTNKINKALGNSIGTCVINNIHDINVVDPVFVIKSDALSGSLENLAKANYVVAGTPFNRRYFITGVDFSTAKTAIVYCHCDVLSTYADSLGTLNFTRGAGDINEMDDASYPISDYLVEQYFPMSDWTDIFSNRGSGRQYLLRTIKGQGKDYPVITITDGQVIWMGDMAGEKYKCWQIRISGTNAQAIVNIREDITGITQVSNNYYLQDGTYLWQIYKDAVEGEIPTIDYLGETT